MKFLSQEYLDHLKEETILLKGAMGTVPWQEPNQNTVLDALFTQIRVNKAKIKFLSNYLNT